MTGLYVSSAVNRTRAPFLSDSSDLKVRWIPLCLPKGKGEPDHMLV
jgi:hypothetical protein